MRLAYASLLSLGLSACTANNPNVIKPGDGGDDLAASDDGGGDGGALDAGDDGGVPCTTSVSCGPAVAGVCRPGIRYCLNGMLGPCIGAVNSTPESCNGADDDCNGSADDGLGMISCGVGACKVTVAACGGTMAGRPTACLPTATAAEVCGNGVDEDCDGIAEVCGCTYVAPVLLGGSDTTGTGQNNAPFATVAKGIAMAGTNSLPMQVCVATDSSTCGAVAASTTFAENIVMKNGVSVFGGYQYVVAGSMWTRPLGTLALRVDGTVRRGGCETVIAPTTDEGVKFDATITSPTALDGFTILGRNNASGATAAVTIAGSTGAVLNDDVILGGASPSPVPMISYGVHVDGTAAKATPLIRNSAIIGGKGATAIGVRVYKSAPLIQDNCGFSTGNAFDATGRCQINGCDSSCFGNGDSLRFIRARPYDNNICNPPGAAPGSIASYGVRLESSPGAEISRSAVCSGNGQGDAAGVRISGDATGVTVRANTIFAQGTNTGNLNAVGVWMDPCGGAAPWIVDNRTIAGGSRSTGARGDGVRAVGDCHPRVDANTVIVGGEESSFNDAYGVFCARDAASGVTSRCTIIGNASILGSGGGFPPLAAGVRCDTGGCARIERNTRISGFQGDRTFGVILDGSGTFVSGNGIEAGCARQEGIGLLSTNSFARVENNVIGGTRWTTSAGNCNPGTMPAATNSYAVRVVSSAGSNELELHSNDLFAFGTPTACTSRAIGFDIDTVTPPSAPRGVVRNNILHAGICNTTYDIDEMSALAEPRLLENNDFWSGPCGAVNALPCAPSPSPGIYRDEASTVLSTVMAVNMLGDITATNNLAVDPGFMGVAFGAMATGNMTPPGIHVDLAIGSMCIDKGTASNAPTVDFYLGMRPVGSGFDVGADEGP